MDIAVTGRNVEVPEHYRTHIGEKLARFERYDRKIIRFDVELFHEPNRKQAKHCQRVEITGKGRGPVVRAEAQAGDFYSALDSALHKLENRLRRIHDRRRMHQSGRGPKSVVEAVSSDVPAPLGLIPSSQATGIAVRELMTETESDGAWDDTVPAEDTGIPWQRRDTGAVASEPGQIVREKEHAAEPTTVDQALSQMELLGHDFYLYQDARTGKPSVVYRRKGFAYGVIRLG